MSADLGEVNPEDLAYIRPRTGRAADEHRASGRAPVGSDADERMRVAVANTEDVAQKWGCGYWSGLRGMR